MAYGYDLYAGRSEAEAFDLLARAEYGHLSVWEDEAQRPALTFMHYVCDPAGRRIEGHLANSNPVLARLAADPRATFTVFGPAAYIPSYWVDPERGVPTSYYGWAQFELEVRLLRDAKPIVAVLRRMLDRFQPEGRHPPLALDDPYWRKMVAAITGLEMHVRAVHSRFKYGQNRSRAIRHAVAGQLEDRGGAQDQAVRDFVLAHLADGEEEGTPLSPGDSAPGHSAPGHSAPGQRAPRPRSPRNPPEGGA
jgi:predicted FMN-binding regulatory protein PaiB